MLTNIQSSGRRTQKMTTEMFGETMAFSICRCLSSQNVNYIMVNIFGRFKVHIPGRRHILTILFFWGGVHVRNVIVTVKKTDSNPDMSKAFHFTTFRLAQKATQWEPDATCPVCNGGSLSLTLQLMPI